MDTPDDVSALAELSDFFTRAGDEFAREQSDLAAFETCQRATASAVREQFVTTREDHECASCRATIPARSRTWSTSVQRGRGRGGSWWKCNACVPLSPEERAMKRVVALLRVSTDEQTVENQRRPIELQAARDGETIAAENWIVEDGVSGAAQMRPGLDAIERGVTAGEIRVVYVWAIDRLLRDRSRWAALVPLFKAKGVELRIVTGGWRLFEQGADPMRALLSELFADFFVAMSVYELALIRARTNAGMARAALDGRLAGRPRLRIDAEELSKARARVAAGESAKAVAPTVQGWMPVRDAVSGKWTEVPWPVSESALRRRLSGELVEERPRA